MNFNKIYDEIIKLFENAKVCVLATVNGSGEIDIAQMNLVSDGLALYFQTDAKFEKVKNIRKNPWVGINIGTYSFKGKAKILGHTSVSQRYIELAKSKHPTAYKNYTNLPDEVLIEVELTEAKIWKLADNEEFIIKVDIKSQTASKIVFDKIKV